MKRPYRQAKRAEAAAETRERIVRATAELHRTVGPRATTVAKVARRAGVDRLTVYNHFPDEAALVLGCQLHWLREHPLPDLSALGAVEDPEERLRAALSGLWRWYDETRAMTANILRDGPAMPALAPVLGGMREAMAGAVEVLSLGRRRALALGPTLLVALAFPTWEALVAEGALTREEAMAAVEGWVRAAEAQ